MTPLTAFRLTRRAIYVIALLMIWFVLREYDFPRAAEDDDAVPSISPGTLLLARSVAKDGELIAGATYLALYPGARAGAPSSLRMVRLVGVAGEAVDRDGERVRIGGRVQRLPAYAARVWPARIRAGHCLVLTDNPRASHPDSRSLGEVPVEVLQYRVLVPLGL